MERQDQADRFSNLEFDDGPVQPTPLESGHRKYNIQNGLDSLEEVKQEAQFLAAHVAKEPLYLADGTEAPEFFATVRTYPDRSRELMGVVRDRYQVVQDSHMLRLIEPLAHNFQSYNFGQWSGKSWLYGQGRWEADVVKGDTIEARALFANSHDGSIPFTLGFPGNRVVCQNTFMMALSSKLSRLLKIRHTASADKQLAQVEAAINVFGQEFMEAADKMRLLAQTKCDDAQLMEYTAYVYRPDQWKSGEWAEWDNMPTRTQNLYNTIQENFEDGPGAEFHRGTAWGAFNAVTQYATHQRGRQKGEARTADLMWGSGSLALNRAWQGLQEVW